MQNEAVGARSDNLDALDDSAVANAIQRDTALGMPHAHVFPNGSVYVIHQNSWRAFRAQHWSGPYTEVPFVFVDSRGKREGVKSPELRGAPQWE